MHVQPNAQGRRDACRALLTSTIGAALVPLSACATDPFPSHDMTMQRHIPAVMLSTWKHGIPANVAGLEVLARGGTALDAVEAGAKVVEVDCPDRTVGLGGMPDRDGIVTLDASIMSDDGRCGAVAAVEGVVHPIALARRVMEDTPHCLLVGDGARQFARTCNLEVRENSLSPEREKAWREWLVEKQYAPLINPENHDTISLLALDSHGHLAAASTTSGLSFKMHGRVGDSPIIGAGLYVEPNAGGAVCTGLGEMVLRTLGAFIAADCMRRGASPQEACEEALRIIMRKNSTDPKSYQVGMLALDFQGRVGAASVQSGFSYALGRVKNAVTTNELFDAKNLL